MLIYHDFQVMQTTLMVHGDVGTAYGQILQSQSVQVVVPMHMLKLSCHQLHLMLVEIHNQVVLLHLFVRALTFVFHTLHI